MNYFDNGDAFAQPGQLFPTEQSPDGFTFDIRRFGGRTSLSREVLETAEMHSELDRVMGHLIVGIDVKVLSHRLLSRTQTQSVGFPANPWQHLKLRFAPYWFVRRWPVKKAWRDVIFHIDVDAAYPQARIPLSEPRLGPAAFHESGHFETDTGDDPAIIYRQHPLSYQDIRNYYAQRAKLEAEAWKRLPGTR